MSKRTYVDANLLIAAWQGKDSAGEKALAILDDPNRALVVSDALWLEVMPKAVYHRQQDEQAFYQAIFDASEHREWKTEVLHEAHSVAETYGLAAMDAIHVATAKEARIDEFVSGEKTTKPMFRVKDLSVRSIRDAAE
jgi:predicted nucleic acid-binding protein